MTIHTPTIFISAGELSGDRLGSFLTTALQQRDPSIRMVGMGGEHMKAAGMEILEDLSRSNINGFFEVLSHLPKIFALENDLKAHIRRIQPTLLILIDYQGLNLRLAKYAKSQNIRTLFYVSPQIWASRYHRIKKIKRYVDHMAVLYQFEKKIYEQENVPVTFVGHPLKKISKSNRPTHKIYQHFNLDPTKPIVTLLPGSRLNELTRMLPVFLEAKQKIQTKQPDAQFTLLLASTLNTDTVRSCCPKDIKLITSDAYDLFSITDAAIAVSGTITLELALFRVPMVITYKVSTFTYHLLKRIMKTNYIGLCNILLNKPVVKEYIQTDANASHISQEVLRLLQNDDYRKKMIHELAHVCDHMGVNDPVENITDCVIQQLHQ